MMDILMSETCWAHKKWNKIASDIKLVFYSSTITTMHGAINIRLMFLYLKFCLIYEMEKWVFQMEVCQEHCTSFILLCSSRKKYSYITECRIVFEVLQSIKRDRKFQYPHTVIKGNIPSYFNKLVLLLFLILFPWRILH